MNPPQAFVIAICGTSGAGKTRLVELTVRLLGDAVALHFDDYRSDSRYPADLGAWLEAGADPDAWQTPRMAADLMALRAGRPVAAPGRPGPLQPRRYVVVEEPFGRARREIAAGIDFAAYLDLPMEIALARKLRRDLAGAARELGAQGALDRVSLFFEEYLEGRGRDAYLAGNQRARESCDLVLDGMLPVELLAREIVHRVTTARREGPSRSTGCIVAAPDSALGAPASV
jgi:uridine kinase